MKYTKSLFLAALVFTFGCNSGGSQDDHGHEHGTETHSHDHENGDHHHGQEEFTVGEDTTATEGPHEHEDGHDHQH